MFKKNQQIRLNNTLYLIENIDGDNYLLKNLKNKTISWYSKPMIKKSLSQIVANKPLKYNDLTVSLLENGFHTTIDIYDKVNHYSKIVNESISNALSSFAKKFKYFNNLTPKTLLKEGFTKSSEQPLVEQFGGQLFYHGSHTKDITTFKGNVFWSTSVDFAEQYGPIIYQAQLDLGKCFDISLKQHLNWLLKQTGGKIDYKDDDYNEKYIFGSNDYKKIAYNNWETVEKYLPIIKGSFNSCKIVEEGTVNYIVFDNTQIKLLKVFNRRLDETVVCEDYAKDKELRSKAEALADAIVKTMHSKNTEIIPNSNYFIIEMDKTYFKICPELKKTGMNFLLFLGNQTKNPFHARGNREKDNSEISVIYLPVIPSDLSPSQFFDYVYAKHHKQIVKLTQQCVDNKCSNDEMISILRKFLYNETRKELYKTPSARRIFSDNTTLVHELTHMLDSFRYTSTYKPQEQDTESDKGLDKYYNSSEEQNAYYQETIHSFKDYIENLRQLNISLSSIKNFKDFFSVFVGKYKGDFLRLTRQNQKRLAKRVYQYWKNAIANDDNNLTEAWDPTVHHWEIQKFKEILAKHHNLVNHYGHKVGASFPDHDLDKLRPDMIVPYTKGFIKGKRNVSPEEWKQFKETQLKHYREASHHLQYWDRTWQPGDLALDVRGKMPDDAIIEMCADWCAMSYKMHSDPYEWTAKHVNKDFLFDQHQIDLIYNTLNKMWTRPVNNKDNMIKPNVVNESLQNNSKLQTNKPLTIIGYHGTMNDFDNFDKKFAKKGFYFATKQRLHSLAGYYAQENGYIIKAKLHFEHPFVGTPTEYQDLYNNHYKEMLSKYDGVITVNDGSITTNSKYYNYKTDKTEEETLNVGDIVEMVVFNPNQIEIIKKVKLKEIKENRFLSEEILYAEKIKNDDFIILKNPSKREFQDALKHSKYQQLRGLTGVSSNSNLYVWDAYYGTHESIYQQYIKNKDPNFDESYVNIMFRKNDYDVWGLTFTNWFEKLGYKSSDNSTNTTPKKEWNNIFTDDDLGLLNESVQNKLNETIVYAGSGNDYEKPSLLAIGTGEGQLAHGYGLYYATDPKIANEYAKRNTLSNTNIGGPKKKGVVHRVEIPNSKYFMNESKFYDRQSSYIQQCLKNVIEFLGGSVDELLNSQPSRIDGKQDGIDIYDYIKMLVAVRYSKSYDFNSAKYASMAMLKFGIKGIKYNGRQDGICYVLFNPNDAKVIDKQIIDNDSNE